MFFILILTGCALTGLKEVPPYVENIISLHIEGEVLSSTDKTRPLSQVEVRVSDSSGETKEYLTDSNGNVSFTMITPTKLHLSSVLYSSTLEEIELKRKGYFTKIVRNDIQPEIFFRQKYWRWGQSTTNTFPVYIDLLANYEKKVVVADQLNNPISGAKVIALSNNKIINRWYTDEKGISLIDLLEAANYSRNCETLVTKDGYTCITSELGYRCFEDDILNLYNVYVKMTKTDEYILGKCRGDFYEYFKKDEALELGYWLIALAKNHGMRLDSIYIKDRNGKKYLCVDLSSLTIETGNRLSDYDLSKRYFSLLVLDYIKSPSYASPKNNRIYGINMNLDTEVLYVSKGDTVESAINNVYELQYYFSNSDTKNFIEQKISRQQFADKTTTIARGDLVDLILR
jgi:hypothetical protein